MRRYNTIILGGGATGLAMAGTLSLEPGRLCIVDEYAEIGGNHLSRDIDGYSFDIGAFVFKRDDRLFSIFPEMQSQLLAQEVGAARLTPQGRVSGYPYALKADLLLAGPLEILLSGVSLAWGRLRYFRPRNAAEYAKSFMGGRIFRESGLSQYIARLFGVEASSIEVEFAQKRMTWIARTGSFSRLLRGGGVKTPLPSAPVVRPAKGFQALYGPARKVLEERRVDFRLGAQIEAISRVGDEFVIRVGGETLQCKRLISSIPVRRAATLMGVSGGERLKSLDLASLYFSFEGERGFLESILYNFSLRGSWKRLTMHSDYYGLVGGREYFSVEAPTDSGAGDVLKRLDMDFRSSVGAAGIFQGDLRLHGADITHYAYPVYSVGATAAAAALIASMEALGVEFAGRQGRFDYIPTANLAVAKALKQLAVGTLA